MSFLFVFVNWAKLKKEIINLFRPKTTTSSQAETEIPVLVRSLKSSNVEIGQPWMGDVLEERSVVHWLRYDTELSAFVCVSTG